MVTLWTQYSTQWDALVHQGALFDADGDGWTSRSTTTASSRTWTSSGRRRTPRATAAGASPSRAPRARAMAAHGVQGRAVLIDVAYHLDNTEEWTAVPMKTVREIMAADKVQVRPGNMVIIHTGFTQKISTGTRTPTRRESRPRTSTSTARTPRCRVDRRFPAVGPDRGQLRGRGLAGAGPRAAHADPGAQPVPVQARHPARRDVVHPGAGDLAASEQPEQASC